MAELVHDLIATSALHMPSKSALSYKKQFISFKNLDIAVSKSADFFLTLDLQKSDRVAIFLEKRIENIVGMFGANRAGGVFEIGRAHV